MVETIAVITGDIVKSRNLSTAEYDLLLNTLERQLENLSHSHSADSYELYRGDSFQLVLNQPLAGVAAMLQIRLALKACSPQFDCRISLGLGGYDRQRHHVGSSTGQAFNLSGLGLEELNRNKQRMAIASENQTLQQHSPLITRFADAIITSLSQSQANALYYYFVGENKQHETIAKQLNSSRANVTKLLNRANYQLIEDYIIYIQTLIRAAYP